MAHKNLDLFMAKMFKKNRKTIIYQIKLKIHMFTLTCVFC
jgi:hypothetical protein